MTLTLYISSIVICDPLAAIHLFDLRNNNLSVCLHSSLPLSCVVSLLSKFAAGQK